MTISQPPAATTPLAAGHEDACSAVDDGWCCNAADGHPGDHAAYSANEAVPAHTWPQQQAAADPPVTADLTALADWIEDLLGDELASRQHIAETALARLRELQATPVLTAADLDTLSRALADAVEWRTPGLSCSDCDDSGDSGDSGELCPDHASDQLQSDSYVALARHFGIEVDR